MDIEFGILTAEFRTWLIYFPHSAIINGDLDLVETKLLPTMLHLIRLDIKATTS